MRGSSVFRADGIDLKNLGIAGKPDPAMFLEAARRIKVRPDEAAVVEDALAGVEAGAHGQFGLVAGVARSRNALGLKEHGAKAVVTDLKELKLADDADRGPVGNEKEKEKERHVPQRGAARPGKGGKRERESLPSALGDSTVDGLVRRSRELVVFLDYDGTLAEIVKDPPKAVISKKTRDVLRSLTSLCTVGILSGRDVQVVRKLVGLQGMIYAGSHGFDIIMADGRRLDNARWDAFLPFLDEAEGELHRLLKGIPGAFAERKRFAIAVHYRLVDPRRVKEVRKRFESVASTFSSTLRRSGGKKVFELLPNVAWDKGKALLYLLSVLKLDDRAQGEVLPIFVGDDLTDETAFRALRRRGLGILVEDAGSERQRGTLARYSLRDPDEVRLFLERLVGMRREKVSDK
jgi:trehalose-phosphatase